MKKAILVYSSFVTRVIVGENDSEEQIAEKARKQLTENLYADGIGEHIEKTEIDLIVPYNEDVDS